MSASRLPPPRVARAVGAVGRGGAEGRVVLAIGLIAAVPVIVSTVRALAAGWVPVYDAAIITTVALDALTSHASLVGVYSDASLPQVGPLYNAGPMVYWLLALPARFPGDWAVPVTVGLVNSASIVGAVALAHRRGGRAFMVATAVGLSVMSRSLLSPPETLHDPVNPSIALLPFTVLLFLAWTVACGEYRWLPLTVLVGSFVIQAHVTVALPALAVLVVAAAALAMRFVTNRGLAGVVGRDRRRWLLAALGVAVVCWVSPVIDQVIHRPGNFVRIVETATTGERTAGLDAGWHALVRATGVPPWWLRAPPGPPTRVYEVFGPVPSSAAVSSAVILGGLTLVGLFAVRRRRPDIAVGAALALVLSATVVISIASTPARLALNIDKAARWTSPVGMFVWLVLIWSLAALFGPTRQRAVARARTFAGLVRPAASAVLGLAITTLVAVLAAAGQDADFWKPIYRPVDILAARVNARAPRHGTLLVTNGATVSSGMGFAVQTGLIYELRRHGYQVVTPDLLLVDKLGRAYSAQTHPPDHVLLIEDAEPSAHPRARVLARVPMAIPRAGRAPDPPRPVTVSTYPIAGASRR